MSFPPISSARLDVGREAEKSCFVVVCLCCYNLGRFEHEVVLSHGDEGPDEVIRAHCYTCGAGKDAKVGDDGVATL